MASKRYAKANRKRCVSCGACAKECPRGAIEIWRGCFARVDPAVCVGCGRCLGACNFDAIDFAQNQAIPVLNAKMAEYTKAVVSGRDCFHISLIVDVSPYCDCHAENDAPILPDIGMFASKDPVALDQACADACLAAEPIRNSVLGDHMHEAGFHDHHDHFKNTTPESEWETQLIHGEKIGLGTRKYDLIFMK